jgi:penicillin-binding protein 2
MCKRLGVPLPELTADKLDESWRKVSQLTATPMADLLAEAERIVSRVQRIKRHVSEQQGVEIVIREEMQAHAVVNGLDQSQQVAARVALAEYPWIEIASSHRRVYQGGAAVAQIVGQLGRVTDEALASDPLTDDRLARYQLDDSFGVAGVEALAEHWLRGRRGQVHEDRLGKELSPPVDPRDGRDVELTLNLALQQALYAIWTRSSIGTGGCAVILDIPTRNVLAMVGYPAVDLNDPADVSRIEPDDPRRPFLFRAVRGNYPPGSIIKPALLAGALADGLVNRGYTETCIGRLYSSRPDKWGCTAPHGPMNAIAALQHSCNVYFYRLGLRMGVGREVYWLAQFGLGQSSGTGLYEEFRGRFPDEKNDAEALLTAIGEGKNEVTPMQAANLIATVANGVHKPVTLWANNPNSPVAGNPLAVGEGAWQIVRTGLYEAVNVHGGTAHKNAGQADFGPYVLLGKTGSAETGPPEWIYPVTFPDGTRMDVRAPDARAVRRRYPQAEVKIDDANKQAPPGYEQTHSWFVGYLAPRDRYTRAVGAGPASIAIAVIVEYAGHGGEVAAPMAVEMLESFLMLQRNQAGSDTGGLSANVYTGRQAARGTAGGARD